MIRKPKKIAAGGGPNVPAYIVTFSDMVTLLLTFFVMLLSMAQVRDPELFNASRDAFMDHINCYGLGMLSGKQMTPEFGKTKVEHGIKEPDHDAETRTIDAEEENLRRLLNKLSQSMLTLRSQITCEKLDFSVANIHFEAGQTELDQPAKDFLEQFVENLQCESQSGQVKLYVLGMANDVSGEKNQWMLSSLRAEKVAEYLKEIFYKDFQCPVFAWGAGPGGHWVDPDSAAYKDSQILIAILRIDE